MSQSKPLSEYIKGAAHKAALASSPYADAVVAEPTYAAYVEWMNAVNDAVEKNDTRGFWVAVEAVARAPDGTNAVGDEGTFNALPARLAEAMGLGANGYLVEYTQAGRDEKKVTSN